MKAKTKNENNEEYRAVKSKLPLKTAIKIGTSSFKHRPVRLIITILLSAIAFTLFGVSAALASFSKTDSITKVLIDSKPEFLALRKWESYFPPSTTGYSSIDRFFGAKDGYAKDIKNANKFMFLQIRLILCN